MFVLDHWRILFSETRKKLNWIFFHKKVNIICTPSNFLDHKSQKFDFTKRHYFWNKHFSLIFDRESNNHQEMRWSAQQHHSVTAVSKRKKHKFNKKKDDDELLSTRNLSCKACIQPFDYQPILASGLISTNLARNSLIHITFKSTTPD